ETRGRIATAALSRAAGLQQLKGPPSSAERPPKVGAPRQPHARPVAPPAKLRGNAVHNVLESTYAQTRLHRHPARHVARRQLSGASCWVWQTATTSTAPSSSPARGSPRSQPSPPPRRSQSGVQRAAETLGRAARRLPAPGGYPTPRQAGKA